MAMKLQRWVWAWVLIGAPGLICLGGQVDVAAHAWAMELVGLVLPGICMGLGTMGLLSLLELSRTARIAAAGTYGIVLYTLTLAFNNMPGVWAWATIPTGN
jgi:hypothetical protein